jgi:hypothetical protein
VKLRFELKGGEGSGFHGHAGIPGHQGGSQADKAPALPPELKRSTGGQTNERQKLRAQIMENKYGVKFSLVTSNPVGVAEGKRLGIPGIGLPRAIYDKSFDEVVDEDKIVQVLEAVKKWKGNQTHLSYTTLKFATGLTFQEVFGVVKYLQRLDPYSISMTVDRLGKNTAVAIKPTVKYKSLIVEKQLPIDDTSKANLVRIRTGMFNNEVDALSEKMYTGGISIGAWEEAMKQLIRELHSSVAAIGKGGWDAMTPADWGRLGPVMKSQYQYLHRFAEKIASERDTISIDYIKARAHLYGNAANNTLAMVQAGQVLTDKLPWLPGDGSTECLINCKCHWSLEIIGKEGEFNIVQAVWHLGEAEHCDDCVERDEYVVTLNVYKTIPIPAIIGYAEKEFRLKGGPGSGFAGHAGIPGHQGGSQAEGGWKADPNAWYIDESIPDATLEATQKWVDSIAARGWNVEEVLAHFHKLGVRPQSYTLNYDPKWGLSAGTYTAYRVGETEDDPTGIYFGPEPKEIEAYAYDKADKVVHEYTVTIKNPLIVEDKNEVVRKFFPNRRDADYEYRVERYITYPNDKPRPYSSWIRSLIDGNKFGHDASAANRWLDAQLASKISKAGYDSLVLLSPELPASREIMVIRNIENNIVFLKEYVVDV